MTAVLHETSHAVRESAAHLKDQAAAIGGKAGRRLGRAMPGGTQSEAARLRRSVRDHVAQVVAAVVLPVAALVTAMRVRRARK